MKHKVSDKVMIRNDLQALPGPFGGWCPADYGEMGGQVVTISCINEDCDDQYYDTKEIDEQGLAGANALTDEMIQRKVSRIEYVLRRIFGRSIK